MQLQYQITLAEYREMAWLRHRSSLRWIVSLCIGALAFIAGIVLYFYWEHWIGLFYIGLSLFLVLLQSVIPGFVFSRFYRRNSRMFGPRTVTIDEAGVVSDHELGHNEATWRSFEKFRETKNLFLIYHSADLIGIVPKRIFAGQPEIEQFRALVTSKIPRQ